MYMFVCTMATGTVLIHTEFKLIVTTLLQLVVFCTCKILPQDLNLMRNFRYGLHVQGNKIGNPKNAFGNGHGKLFFRPWHRFLSFFLSWMANTQMCAYFFLRR